MRRLVLYTFTFLFILSSFCYASTSEKKFNIEYEGVELNIDGVNIIPKDVLGNIVDPFIIDGTTYLPVRAISESLGKDVSWKDETSSVYISDSDSIRINNLNSGDYNREKFIGMKEKTLIYRNIKVYINNVLLEPKDVNGTLVEPFIIEGTTYLPIRAVATAFGKDVDWNGETKTVYIKSNGVLINGDEVLEDDKNDIPSSLPTPEVIQEIEDSGDKDIESSNSLIAITDVIVKIINETVTTEISTNGSLENYKYYALTDPDRLVIDLKDSVFDMDTSAKDINYKPINRIRFGKQENDVSRIVLDIDELDKYTYTVVQNDGKDLTYLALNESFVLPSENNTKTDNLVASNDDKIYIDERDLSVISSVKYSSVTNRTKVKITEDYEYEVFTLENPYRIVIDFKNSKLESDGPYEITPTNNVISAIRFSQNESDKVRLVFETKEKADYIIDDSSKTFSIEIIEDPLSKIEYMSYSSYSKIVLKNCESSDFDIEKLAKKYKYNILFSSSDFDMVSNRIDVNDDLIDHIQTYSNKISINYNEDITVSKKQEGDNVVFTIKPSEKKNTGDFVILLDAGHGGNDPGAINGDYQEKNYNLKIVQKLYDLLNDTDGIDVRLTRDDDTYLNAKDRLDKIIENDDANLVVSVHHNSLNNKDYNGTMVLYYDKPGEKKDYGITSKEVATIVKDKLVDSLGTLDKGVINRPDLVILAQNTDDKYDDRISTHVPAILCEVACISNDDELKRIITSKFQKNAAEAIYDGIMEVVDLVK